MFESAEIGHRVDRKTYKREEPLLRQALLGAQYELLRQARTAVVVLVNGVPGAGKGETVNLFNEWMDPRHIRTEAFGPAGRDGRPDMYRFWQVLPPKGHIGILFGSWYADPLGDFVTGQDKPDRFHRRLERIRQFEQMLVAEGVVLVKLWFHLSRKAAKARYKALESDPRTAWRVSTLEWDHLKHHDEWVRASDEALRLTGMGGAPWQVIEGSDEGYRSLCAGRLLLDAIHTSLAAPPATPPARPAGAPLAPALDGKGLLDTQDYGRRLGHKRYEDQLETLQGRLNGLSRRLGERKRSLVLVFEGMDAAGKGSTIRRITQAMDARHYRVVPVAAPNENERAQPYLWRFWRYIPHQGHTVLFDRSWYGRVLVERVEGFCTEADWMRGYGEINDFEEQLAEAGAVVVKFWLAITTEEQLRRFDERKNTPYKQYKITEDDWRNRARWPLYARAVGDMIDRTSTRNAPWHVVASDDKLWSRIEVLRTLCERLEAALD
jgi:polyphosphate:AMP phosphotransferase